MSVEGLAERLGKNLKQLRETRGLSQAQVARLARLPRATWANLESGGANPTLAVLHAVAEAFQVTLEELVAAPKASCQFYPRASLKTKKRGEVVVQKLLPDPIPGMEIDRFTLPPRATMVGVPHTAGTREYLTCEAGQVTLIAAGERWDLEPGDVVVFRGDQRHSYQNAGNKPAVAYSVVVLARPD